MKTKFVVEVVVTSTQEDGEKPTKKYVADVLTIVLDALKDTDTGLSGRVRKVDLD